MVFIYKEVWLSTLMNRLRKSWKYKLPKKSPHLWWAFNALAEALRPFTPLLYSSAATDQVGEPETVQILKILGRKKIVTLSLSGWRFAGGESVKGNRDYINGQLMVLRRV